ncbi:MAG: YidC/Oxa1 family membrane protein insertase [Firmicutes bacterium]|nr:YidC/Oxa1 family membrane protein insertase [Bacillota bacterium]
MTVTNLLFATTPIVGAGFFGTIWQGIKNGFVYALEGIFDLTNAIHIPSYVLALFIFTLILKLLLQPLMNKQLRSTRMMQRLTPEVNEIKRRYANDQMKQNQKVMELYKEHNASPTAGCLPLLLQIPILWALFQALREFTPAHPEFYKFFWIPNLSEPDPTRIVLPLLAAVATFLQQRISTVNAADRTQKMMLYIFPVMFFFMVQGFPSGLGFYWIFYSLIGAAIMIPLKRKWAAEDKAFEEEQAAKKAAEAEEKRKRKAEAIERKKKNPKKPAQPIYHTEEGDFVNDVDAFDEEELDFDAEPEEGEDLYHWLARRGIRVKRKKMRLHPYSTEEEVVETCLMPDGKEVDIQSLRREYQALTQPAAAAQPPPDLKTLLGLGKKNQEQAEKANNETEG